MSAPPLWLALRLPLLPLEAHSRGLSGADAMPLAVVAREAGALRVTHANPAARRGGVQVGMARTAAVALVPELIAVPRDRGRERALLQTLGAWAYGRSSRVSLVGPPEAEPEGDAGLLLEVAGSRRLLGSPRAQGQAAAAALEARGLGAAWAVAPTPLAAWWLAAFRSTCVVPLQEELPAALAPLPLALLELSGEARDALAGSGITQVGAVLEQPRAALARRVGAALAERLDRALGRRPDPRPAFRPPEVFRGRLPLPAPARDREALRFPLRRLLEELEDFLAPRSLGVERLRLTLVDEGGGRERLGVGLASPCRDARRLDRVLQARLEGATLPGVVAEIRLDAESLSPLAPEAPDLFTAADDTTPAWDEVRARLEARLGEGSLEGLALAADWRPERAWRRGGEGAAALPGPRPLWLLAEPRPLTLQGGRPCLGEALRLCRGPERIEGGWWDGQDVSRAYFVAEAADGRRLWIFQDCRAPGRWYLHGLLG